MTYKLLLLATVLALADGAALVRFINLVPTRTSLPSVMGQYAASAGGGAAPTPVNIAMGAGSYAYPRLVGNGNLAAQNNFKAQAVSDRVGLYYYAYASTTVTTPTVVWTQILESNDVVGTNAPYAWYHGQPCLRPYHLLAASVSGTLTETIAVDTPLSAYQASGNGDSNTGTGATAQWTAPPHAFDMYDQTRLKADGVGLYLSFAAGTYQVQAYSVMSSVSTVYAAGSAPALDNNLGTITAGVPQYFTQSFNTAPRIFSGTSTSITLQDNMVYTLVAYGYAAYSATIPYTGANVQLTLLTESVTSAPFGMASLRFFHGIQTQMANSISVYQGSFSSTVIASNLAFGTVSNYVTVPPGLTSEFPLALPGSSITPLATGINVQRDVRAGMVATVFCAQTDEASNTIFCRAIPSRAVAYVRLVADTAGQNSQVQGNFGPQRLSQTALTLWASYELPRPEQVIEGSQIIGNHVWSNHPATTEGLYPVVQGVNPGTVSGYGEVFVPLYIMDFAIRWVVLSESDRYSVVTTGAAPTTTTANFPATASTYGGSPTLNVQTVAGAVTTSQSVTVFGPVHKRVHFVVKTSGFASLSGQILANRNIITIPSSEAIVKASTPAESYLEDMQFNVGVDEYLEPGQYYTIFAFASNYAGGAQFSSNLGLNLAYQDGGIVRLAIRLDRTIPTIAQGVSSSQGVVTFIPFVQDEYNSGATLYGLTQAFYVASVASGTAGSSYATSGSLSLQLGSTTVTPTLSTAGLNRALLMTDSLKSFSYNTLALAGAAANPNNFPPVLVANFGAAAAIGDAADIVVTPGVYSYAYTAPTLIASPTTTTASITLCYNNIPSGSQITVTAGAITDVFVLGAFNCYYPTAGSTQNLQVVTALRQSAMATGNSPVSFRRSAPETSIPLYSSASSTAASLLFAIFAAIVAVFAL